MARVTVEDCVEKVSNRFELVMLAAQRAREVSSGSPLTVDRDNDKNPVVALREIADSTVGLDDLQENLIRSLQRNNEFTDDDDDDDEVVGDAYDGVAGPVVPDGDMMPDGMMLDGAETLREEAAPVENDGGVNDDDALPDGADTPDIDGDDATMGGKDPEDGLAD